MVPTLTLARAASHFDCGLMITASHNPPEYNGVRMWNKDGSAFDEEQIEEVERLIINGGKMTEWGSMLQEQRWEGAITGDDVKTGINAMIEPGTVIWEGTIIGMGALVRGNIGPSTNIF